MVGEGWMVMMVDWLGGLGKLYGSGWNGNGELGLGNAEEFNMQKFSFVEITVPSSSKMIVQVACGRNHSVALTSEGECFAWGDNGKGQLGVGDLVKRLSPTPIVVPNVKSVLESRFQSIACGMGHTVALNGESTMICGFRN